MDEETIVAVYDTVAHAELAIADLEQAGIPASAISRHAGETVASGTVKEEGFWSKLFGGEPDRDTDVYDRSLQSGSTVVTVRIGEQHVDTVMDILESHHPVDLDERAASYGMTTMPSAAVPYAAVAPRAASLSDDATLSLSEERIAIGKRVVNRGGTRVHRFVVETPVEERVTLHEERVTLERRPVTDGSPVTNADFTDKTIEMTETAEEAVVSKNTFVTEEIRLRKEATDRVETIRDTVRKEDVEIEQIPGSTTTTTGSTLLTKPYDAKV